MVVAHLKYNSTSKTYISASDDDQGLITAVLTPRLPNKAAGQQTQIKIRPDSGASICVGGPKHATAMNVDLKDLIPTNKRIEAVGGSRLQCFGWLPVAYDIEGHCTRQPLSATK